VRGAESPQQTHERDSMRLVLVRRARMVSVLVELKTWPARWRAGRDKVLIARPRCLRGRAFDWVSEKLTTAHGAPPIAKYLYLGNICHCSPNGKGFSSEAVAKTVRNLYIPPESQ